MSVDLLFYLRLIALVRLSIDPAVMLLSSLSPLLLLLLGQLVPKDSTYILIQGRSLRARKTLSSALLVHFVGYFFAILSLE